MHFNSCLAPCQSRCPAQIDIPNYVRAMRKAALRTPGHHQRAQPHSLCIGRVCPHPCEDNCRRGLDEDPININHLKRFAADYEMYTLKKHIKPLCCPRTSARSPSWAVARPG
jgi:formate dehydrogenase beta subunit